MPYQISTHLPDNTGKSHSLRIMTTTSIQVLEHLTSQLHQKVAEHGGLIYTHESTEKPIHPSGIDVQRAVIDKWVRERAQALAATRLVTDLSQVNGLAVGNWKRALGVVVKSALEQWWREGGVKGWVYYEGSLDAKLNYLT